MASKMKQPGAAYGSYYGHQYKPLVRVGRAAGGRVVWWVVWPAAGERASGGFRLS